METLEKINLIEAENVHPIQTSSPASSSRQTENQQFLLGLPLEIFMEVLAFLPINLAMAVVSGSKTLRKKLLEDNAFWTAKYLRYFNFSGEVFWDSKAEITYQQFRQYYEAFYARGLKRYRPLLIEKKLSGLMSPSRRAELQALPFYKMAPFFIVENQLTALQALRARFPNRAFNSPRFYFLLDMVEALHGANSPMHQYLQAQHQNNLVPAQIYTTALEFALLQLSFEQGNYTLFLRLPFVPNYTSAQLIEILPLLCKASRLAEGLVGRVQLAGRKNILEYIKSKITTLSLTRLVMRDLELVRSPWINDDEKVQLIDWMEAKKFNFLSRDAYERTALHDAAFFGNLKVVKRLIKEIPLSVVDRNGQTPLHMAAFSGDLNLMKFMVQNGSNPFALDKLGNSVLHLIASSLDDDLNYNQTIIDEIFHYFLTMPKSEQFWFFPNKFGYTAFDLTLWSRRATQATPSTIQSEVWKNFHLFYFYNMCSLDRDSFNMTALVPTVVRKQGLGSLQDYYPGPVKAFLLFSHILMTLLLGLGVYLAFPDDSLALPRKLFFALSAIFPIPSLLPFILLTVVPMSVWQTIGKSWDALFSSLQPGQHPRVEEVANDKEIVLEIAQKNLKQDQNSTAQIFTSIDNGKGLNISEKDEEAFETKGLDGSFPVLKGLHARKKEEQTTQRNEQHFSLRETHPKNA